MFTQRFTNGQLFREARLLHFAGPEKREDNRESYSDGVQAPYEKMDAQKPTESAQNLAAKYLGEAAQKAADQTKKVEGHANSIAALQQQMQQQQAPQSAPQADPS